MKKSEKEYQRIVREIGCICCYLSGYPGTHCAIHHVLSGGRRIGEMSVLGLCDPGHHQYPPKGSGKIARHPNRVAFCLEYGSEEYLLAETQRLVAEQQRRAA